MDNKTQDGQECQTSNEPLAPAYNCIAFFASCIRCGEKFDDTYEKSKQRAYEALKHVETMIDSHRKLVEAMKETVKEIRTQADLDYCVGCAEATTNPLIMGEDAHLMNGTFSKAHLNAHRAHTERMSRHKHLNEAARMIDAALNTSTS